MLNNGERKYYNFGFADPDKKMLFDSATIFEIGSITKTFTAYVLESILTEKGINDSSAVWNIFPDSVQQIKALESITFLGLMNHTSGLHAFRRTWTLLLMLWLLMIITRLLIFLLI
ncbi:MAG: serine hydrolase [Bacteroidota bacterium]